MMAKFQNTAVQIRPESTFFMCKLSRKNMQMNYCQ